MLERADVERRIEELQRSLDELRPSRPGDRRRGSIVVTDLIDRCGHYLYVDPGAEDLLGFPPRYYETEVDWLAFNHRDDRDRIRVLWRQALNGRFCPLAEYRTDNADGDWVWLEDSFRPRLIGHDGRVVVLEGRWRDITSRKRQETEDRLRELERYLHGAACATRHRFGMLLPFPGEDRLLRSGMGRRPPLRRRLGPPRP
jgi:PAS domain S-box-containing protein